MGANLCTTADVEALLQADISPDNDPKVVALLEMATAELEAEAGREFLPGALVDVAIATDPVPGLYLPHWPLASVQGVTEDGTALVAGTDYATPTAEDLRLGRIRRLDGSGNLALWPDQRFTDGTVLVSYTPAAPAELRGHCARLVALAVQAGAANAAAMALGLTGVKQLTVGRWSATTGTAATTPGVSLDDAARQAARAWAERRP